MQNTTEELIDKGLVLPLVENFYTIQGEGYHTGKAAYFLRIGGCDIGCSWCDSRFSWNRDLHPLVEVDEIVRRAKQQSGNAVVITGGEPLTYNMVPLCQKLKEAGLETFLETSGAYPLSGQWNWICLSPKKQTPPLQPIFDKANELKVIIREESDFIWAEENAQKVNSGCTLFLQPEWSRYKENIHKIVDYVLNNPKWMISLQAHKFMRIP
jgi:7-carboxy-7-deazaguanine synthase